MESTLINTGESDFVHLSIDCDGALSQFYPIGPAKSIGFDVDAPHFPISLLNQSQAPLIHKSTATNIS